MLRPVWDEIFGQQKTPILFPMASRVRGRNSQPHWWTVFFRLPPLTTENLVDWRRSDRDSCGRNAWPRRRPGPPMRASIFSSTAVAHPVRQADGKTLRTMMERVTGQPAVMWGPSIVGFGSYHYRYASGHEGDMCRVGFSPRAANLVLYVGSFPEYEALLDKLGKHKRSTACLYLTRLADVDMGVLEEIARRTYAANQDASAG